MRRPRDPAGRHPLRRRWRLPLSLKCRAAHVSERSDAKRSRDCSLRLPEPAVPEAAQSGGGRDPADCEQVGELFLAGDACAGCPACRSRWRRGSPARPGATPAPCGAKSGGSSGPSAGPPTVGTTTGRRRGSRSAPPPGPSGRPGPRCRAGAAAAARSGAVQRRGKRVQGVGEPATDDHSPGRAGRRHGERRAERRGDAIEGGRAAGSPAPVAATSPAPSTAGPAPPQWRRAGPAACIPASRHDRRQYRRPRRMPSRTKPPPVAATRIRPPLSMAEPMPVPIASDRASARSNAAPGRLGEQAEVGIVSRSATTWAVMAARSTPSSTAVRNPAADRSGHEPGLGSHPPHPAQRHSGDEHSRRGRLRAPQSFAGAGRSASRARLPLTARRHPPAPRQRAAGRPEVNADDDPVPTVHPVNHYGRSCAAK